MAQPRATMLSCLLALCGCLSTRLVQLQNVDVTLSPRVPAAGWRADMQALLDRYADTPVLAPEDPRLEPLLGGLTTLSFFGADAAQRVHDQQLAPGAARGQSLASACTATQPAALTTDAPNYLPVWLPLSIRGGPAPAGVTCDERGGPQGPDAASSFCAFGRLALQPTAAPMIMVVHGLFDSGAQQYPQQLAAALFRQGRSVLLPDMRDHGDTLRAAPQLASTLGSLEGQDLLALARTLRDGCGARVTQLGVLGVSGGGLDAIRAFTADEHALLDAGVLALSPLLDVERTLRELSQTGDCPITRSFELTWSDDLLLGAATGLGFFAGAAVSDLVQDRTLSGYTALAGGIGLGVGLLGAAAVDAWLDGGSDACVSQSAIARIVQDCLHVRWRALIAAARPGELLLSPAGKRLAAESVTLPDYLHERVQFLAQRGQLPLQLPTAQSLASDLRRGLRARPNARLMVLGADDDPLVRSGPLHTFIERTQDLPQLYARSVRHGGHGSLWVVQPTVMAELLRRFFAPM